MKLVDIGLTSEGRHTWMAIITSPENHQRLAGYTEISQRLAAGITSEQARGMAREGKGGSLTTTTPCFGCRQA